MSKSRLTGKTLKVSGLLEELEKDNIKDRVDIVSLFQEFGVSLNQKGKSWTGLCPFHEDKNPSLSVDREKGLYNCFGCGESGDVVTLVEKMKHLSFREALSFLQKRGGAAPAPNTPRSALEQESSQKSISLEIAERRDSGKTHATFTLNEIAEFYHKKLYESKEAKAYLEGRGFKDPAIFTRFKLGFADGSILDVVTNGQREALKVLGILRDKGAEHLAGCIVFPILDENDQVKSLYGRRTGETEPKHLYLSGPHKGVWNRKASRVYDEIMLAESIIDALSLVALGFENVQAVYGTNGFTDEHLQVLKDDRVKTVVIAFDADAPGRKAAAILKDRLLTEAFTVKVIAPAMNEGGQAVKDWNEYLAAGGKAEEVKALIAAADVESPAPDTKPSCTVKKEMGVYKFSFDRITYQLAGVKELFVQDLRVNIKAVMDGETFYDKLDLYSARSRASYGVSLSALFGVESKRVERDLAVMLEHLEEERNKALFLRPEEKELTPEETRLGMEFLASPDLFDQVVRDMESLGYVGEDLNKKLVYLAASSRVLDDPISVLILSQSASGKSMLVDTVKRLLPPSDVIALTSLSDQALNYIPSLMYKFLILGEAVHNEVIEHQIREMLSGKELSRLVTLKDPKTGALESRLVKTPALVSCVMSTTRPNINPENASRFFVINTDESRTQTRRIHEIQRKKYTLLRYQEKEKLIPEIIRKHHAAQRLLGKVVVVNRFAFMLDFPDMLMRTRRDHDRFIDLIACVCFFRQFQKQRQEAEGLAYVDCDLEDYKIAYDIMIHGVLASTMVELPKSAVELYEELRLLAKERAKKEKLEVKEVSFTQREVREKTGLGHSWIRENMRKLVEYEYVGMSGGRQRGERGSYRLKGDEEIHAVNLSMIPSPAEIQKRMQVESEHGEQK